MTELVGRAQELRQLRTMVDHRRRGGLVVIYGQHGVGKTALVRRWLPAARAAGWRTLYWRAVHGTRAQLLRRCAESVGQQLGDPAALASAAWPSFFVRLKRATSDRPTIFVFDALERAEVSNPYFPALLATAWKHWFTDTDHMLVIVSGTVDLIAELLKGGSLLRRLATRVLHLQPLPFATVGRLFPSWSAYERLLAYACIGGMPGYLQRFDRPTLEENVRRHLLDPSLPLRDELRRAVTTLTRMRHLAEPVLYALAGGARTVDEVVAATGVSHRSADSCLEQLCAHDVVTRDWWYQSRLRHLQERYAIDHPLVHSYLRFVDPHLLSIARGEVEAAWDQIRPALAAHAATTVLARLARRWVRTQGERETLPFVPEDVRSHWSSGDEVDVVAKNSARREVLLGACVEATETDVGGVVAPLERSLWHVARGSDWQVHYAVFVCGGPEAPACRAFRQAGVLVVDLEQLERDLQRAAAEAHDDPTPAGS